ncbi:hypothetical protein E8E15_001561 [Penicillium rubens]|nr:hypothetical protein E8E15_001561 [Penicillium rubens]
MRGGAPVWTPPTTSQHPNSSCLPYGCTHWSNSTGFLDPPALQKPASTLPRGRSPLGGALVSRVRAPSKSITQAGRVPRVTVYATTASAMV